MIYSKLDWYTVVLYSTDIFSVLDKLEIKHDLFEEFLQSGYERSQGFSSVFVYACSGLSIELKYDDYLTTDSDSIFTTTFSKIRLDISGKGLDYLRGRGFDCDLHFTDELFWGIRGTDYKITRADFAFDFVNYMPGFMDEFLSWIKSGEMAGILSPGNSRLITGRISGVQYSYRCGDQKTLYLGSTRGDKLVRIYDKLLEQSKNGVLVNPLPQDFTENELNGQVDSWFRIEFQCRRKCADDYLFGIDGDLSRVLRVVFDDYKIRDPKTKEVLPFIEKLYDWDSLPPMYKVEHFVQLPTVIESSQRFITGQAFKSIFFYTALYGKDALIAEINKRCSQIYSTDSAASSYTEISLRNNLVRLLFEEHKELDDLPGIERRGDRYYLKETPNAKRIAESFNLSPDQYFNFYSSLLKKDYQKALDILTIKEFDLNEIILSLLKLIN